jgi:hypothetical protein
LDSLAYLRLLQKNVPPRAPAPFDEIIKLRSGEFNKTIAEMRRISNKYSILSLEGQEKFLKDFLIDPFLRNIPPNISAELKDIRVGMLPTFNPNASAIQVPGNGPLIILHTELLAAISFYNELQILAGKHYLKSEFDEGSNLQNFGHKFLVDCFRKDRTVNFPILPLTLSEKEMIIVQRKTLSNELFIIAHEFAHIYLKHFHKNKISALNIAGKGISIRRYDMAQQSELDADIQAVKWLAYINDNKDKNDLTLPSVGMAVEVLMLVHIFEINQPRNMKTSSHPLAITRLQNISDKCESILNKLDREFIAGMVDNAADTNSFKIRP